MNEAANRSVSIGGSVTGSVIQTGDGNSGIVSYGALPPAATVNIDDVLKQFAALIDQSVTPEAGRSQRALADAECEIAQAEPDKGEIASHIARAAGYAKKAIDIGVYGSKLAPLLHQIASWVGPEHYRLVLDAIL